MRWHEKRVYACEPRVARPPNRNPRLLATLHVPKSSSPSSSCATPPPTYVFGQLADFMLLACLLPHHPHFPKYSPAPREAPTQQRVVRPCCGRLATPASLESVPLLSLLGLLNLPGRRMISKLDEELVCHVRVGFGVISI